MPRERETTPRQPRLWAVWGSAPPGLAPRAFLLACAPAGAPTETDRLGAVPHFNDTLRTISDHARRFGGGQWSIRSVSRGSWQHEPTRAPGQSRSGQAKARLLPRDCPETAPRSAPMPKLHVPRATFHAAPVELVKALKISHEIRSGKVGFCLALGQADLGVVSGQRRRIQCVGARFRGRLALSGHNLGPRSRAPGAADHLGEQCARRRSRRLCQAPIHHDGNSCDSRPRRTIARRA